MRKLLYMEFLLAAIWAFIAGLEVAIVDTRGPVNPICSTLCALCWWLNWNWRLKRESSNEES